MVDRICLGSNPPDRSAIGARVLASVKKGVSEDELTEPKASFVYGNAPTGSRIARESARHPATKVRLK
jgi:hypothetical protein